MLSLGFNSNRKLKICSRWFRWILVEIPEEMELQFGMDTQLRI